MPRIIPIQLLRCLKVLLNQNGGILSQSEVQRISCLMTKYSKKLVSKCIYVQILKCTETDLLDDFMRVGGFNLVFGWLNDGIRLSNWPLVQEVVELLLLCPVDVTRLRTNTAPRTIKNLSINGGTEAVRILADRLVKQWLKVLIVSTDQLAQANASATATDTATVANAVVAQSTSESKNFQEKLIKTELVKTEPEYTAVYLPETVNTPPNDTASQKKVKSGLVYKIVVKDGQNLLKKVEPKTQVDPLDINHDDGESSDMVDCEDTNVVVEEDEECSNAATNDADGSSHIVEDDSISFDKIETKDSGESSLDGMTSGKTQKERKSDSQELRKSKDSKGNSSSSSKDHKSDKDKERKSSSSSSSHRSSSSTGHKSSSKSSSSSSKSKSSSSSSSSHRSSSDKHRSSSSSSKDKDSRSGSSSSSSSKHKSSTKSSSSSSLSSKERHRDKSSSSSSSTTTKKDKERERDSQIEKDKDTLAKMLPPSLDKLGKIPKKPRLDDKDQQQQEAATSASSSNNSSNKPQPTSIIIPSKKSSMSIEIRRDAEKTSAVKTYKSQFRSHGLTEEAPPPPSRKTLKKTVGSSSSATQAGTVHLPSSLPSSSLKRASPPPKDANSSSSSTAGPSEKKQKIDVNSIVPAAATAAEKPGAIKIIPPKRIQTLVETNLFSDALSAATEPKKLSKRKRPTSGSGKDEPTTPTSPDAPKVAPLKFYQDTLDESAKAAAGEDKTKTDADANDVGVDKDGNDTISLDDDDDIPLKKVKEDIEKRVRNQKKDENSSDGEKVVELSDSDDVNGENANRAASPIVDEVRKPGPGCGPDGPPGVLMLHRRKGPKKKLTWRPQESLEQVRYFESDENERVNVMKVSFLDMKNMERFNERTSITNMTKRGPRPGDTQEPRTEWRPLIEIDDVPEHPYGSQSKERKVQAEREMTTLRALYFSPNMIPDSPSEAELEPHSSMDPPTIPLDDITGNPDAINDFTDMPWPEPKGAPRSNEAAGTGGLGNLGNAADMFGVVNAVPVPPAKPPTAIPPTNPFSNFMNPFGGNPPPGVMPANNIMSPVGPPMQMSPSNVWQGPPRMQNNMPNANMMGGNPFQGSPNQPDMMMGGGPPHHNFMGPQSNGPGFNGPPQRQFMQGNNSPFGPPGFGPNGPNFGPMGPNGPPMGPNGPMMMPNMGPQMNNMGPVPPQMNNMGHSPSSMNGMGGMGNGPNNRKNLNWTHGPNRRDHDNWRHGHPGNNNNGVCKAYMRGNCSVKNCKYLHPKSRR